MPPQSGSNYTLLGDDTIPAADVTGDLNRTPATNVELRFRHVVLENHDTGFDHAYVLITDNRTRKQYIHQAGPFGTAEGSIVPYPLGRISVASDEYKPGSRGFGEPSKQVAVFQTDASAEAVRDALNGFGDEVQKKAIPYSMPDIRIPFVGPNPHPMFPTPNSNLYGGAAWKFLTGVLPALPADIDAPGWGNHELPNSPLK